jgi:hypothetical protein
MYDLIVHACFSFLENKNETWNFAKTLKRIIKE